MQKAIQVRRYYGGCEYVDIVEDLARDRAKEIFGAEHVNVQPHSGAQANMAVYFTVFKPGDTVLGMNLSHGGHLTHGSPLTLVEFYIILLSMVLMKKLNISIMMMFVKKRLNINQN